MTLIGIVIQSLEEAKGSIFELSTVFDLMMDPFGFPVGQPLRMTVLIALVRHSSMMTSTHVIYGRYFKSRIKNLY